MEAAISTGDNSCMPFDAWKPSKSTKPVKYKITPEMHDKIKRAYRIRSGHSGEINALAKRLGLPRWKVTRYAINHGWIEKQKKEPRWSDSELRILKKHAMHCPSVAKRALKKAGYDRSETAIVVKRKRMRYLQNLDGMAATMLAECLGEDTNFVLKAIKNGRLKAEKRKGIQSVSGNGVWFISERNIKRYIIENVHEIDLRKVEKFWFVGILTGADI